jgi:uncharacterized protein (DUF885 family)
MSHDPRVEAIADDFSVADARAHPERATASGDHRFDDRLTALDDEGRDAAANEMAAIADRLEAIDRRELDDVDRMTCEVLAACVAQSAAQDDLDLHRWSLDPLAGPHLGLLELIEEDHPRRDLTDGEMLLARLRAAPAYLESHRVQLAAGREEKLVAPKVLAERVAVQLDAILAGRAKSVIESAIGDLERSTRNPALAASLRATVDPIVAAYAALRDEVRGMIIPLAREVPGLCALPSGNESYRALCRFHTTTDLDPDALHALGRATVAAAEKDLRAAARRLGHADPRDARAALAAAADGDPLAPARDFLERAAPLLAESFVTLPNARCRVTTVPASQGDSTPAAYYIPPADGEDRGAFYVNLHRDRRPPPHRLCVLTAHEALPGHHLQLCHAIESPSLPQFRKRVEFTAYVEGWGLYAERLADELGLFDDAARFALAEHRAWRAARLIVDTGLHALGWSTEKARAELAAWAPLSPDEVDAEIERQVADPGQALAYTVGEHAIVAAREAARARLGDRFALPRFHRRVLDPGALPLPLLARHVEAWDGT